jgi:hypothetical protein
LVIAGAALDANFRGDFRRGGELSREAMQGVRTSPHPGEILITKFQFIDPPNLSAALSAALQILDEVGADPWDHAVVRCARDERAYRQPHHVGGGPLRLCTGVLASDPTAAQAALEEHIQFSRGTGYGFMLARALPLLAQLLVRAGNLPAAVEALREALVSAHINGDQTAIAVCLARGAVIMVALGEYETAAVFLGAVTSSVLARRSGVSPNEIPDYSEFVTILRSQLGDVRHTAATNRGPAMTHEQANAFALAAIEGLGETKHLPE